VVPLSPESHLHRIGEDEFAPLRSRAHSLPEAVPGTPLPPDAQAISSRTCRNRRSTSSRFPARQARIPRPTRASTCSASRPPPSPGAPGPAPLLPPGGRRIRPRSGRQACSGQNSSAWWNRMGCPVQIPARIGGPAFLHQRIGSGWTALSTSCPRRGGGDLMGRRWEFRQPPGPRTRPPSSHP
jgi:hypothetical protein